MTKQELYDEIKKSSKDAFILEDMKRLGFWGEEKPKLANELIEKKVALQKELNSLSSKIKDPQSAIKEIHKKRMAEALKKREATRAKKEEQKKEKIAKRAKRKEEEIGFIGHSYIKDLSTIDDLDIKKLKSLNLPEIQSAKELSQAIGVDLGELRFLIYSPKLSTTSHYVKFKIAKKSGGFRDISAPMPRLKRLQYWILDNLLYKVPVSGSAHGFVKGKNIISNASLHIQKSVVINCDLEDFFPTISFARVQGLFKSFGYSTQVATIFALLLTEPEQQKIIVDEREYFLSIGQRLLPQGSPASPMVSNLICKRLDSRFEGICKSLGFQYSRYADDLTFSSDSYENISKMLFWAKKITAEEGFTLHPKKTKVMRRGSSQRVTGIVVNEKLSIPREDLKRFRALLHKIDRDGLEGSFWNGKREDILLSILGYANFINTVEPQKGEIYTQKVRELLNRYPIKKQRFSESSFRESSSNPQSKNIEDFDGSLESNPDKRSVMANIINIFRKNDENS